MGIEILPPHVNHSEKGFSVPSLPDRSDPKRIWYGLEAVKGLGGKVVDAIIAANPDKVEQVAWAPLTREQAHMYQAVVDQLLTIKRELLANLRMRGMGIHENRMSG